MPNGLSFNDISINIGFDWSPTDDYIIYTTTAGWYYYNLTGRFSNSQSYDQTINLVGTSNFVNMTIPANSAASQYTLSGFTYLFYTSDSKRGYFQFPCESIYIHGPYYLTAFLVKENPQ